MPQKPSVKQESPQAPVVRIVLGDSEGLDPADVGQILQEINNRQWAAVTEVLIEAKSKAESMLRNDQIYDSPGRASYYQGWVAYADYIIGSLDQLRQRPLEPDPATGGTPQPGPE